MLLPSVTVLLSSSTPVMPRMADSTREDWWTRELGHLGAGARANVTVVDPHDKLPTFVFVNGVMAAMENRPVREANGAGGWVTKFGILERTGVGDLAAFAYHQA